MAGLSVSGSRYATPGSAQNTDLRVGTSGSGSTTNSTSGASTTNSSQTQQQQQSSVENNKSTTKNLSGSQTAALDSLIRQLLSGGTPEMKAAIAARQHETGQVGAIRDSYSKEAAFGDSQGLISQQMRRTLEQLLPSINRAAEDAGSSGGALRALLLQDAANKAAESSAALGVQTAGTYGGIAANLSQVMERLTQQDPTVTTALLNALNVAKGATSTTTGTKTTDGSSTTQTTGTQQTSSSQSSAGTSSENKNVNYDYAPFGVTQKSTAPVYFGPSADTVDAGKFVGTTMDTLAQLAGGGSPWQQYSF
jgi:hypothetical protein